MNTKRMSTPARQSAPSRNCWKLTQDRISHLNACAAQGMTLTAAARELGVHRQTILMAADRSNKTEWLRQKFPTRQGEGGGKKRHELARREDGLRKLKPEQIAAPLNVPNNPQTRWLTKEWRSAA